LDFESHFDYQEYLKCSSIWEMNILDQFKRNFTNTLLGVGKIDQSSKVNVVEAIQNYPTIVQQIPLILTPL